MVKKKKNELTSGSEPEAPAHAKPAPEETASGRAAHGYTALSELKALAAKIISGESRELDHTITGEMGELIRLLVDIKDKVDEISPSVLSSAETLPYVQSTLTDVNDTTEKAAHNLLASAQQMGEFYKSLQSGAKDMEKTLQDKDMETFDQLVADISTDIQKADNLGFKVLESLEFQDVTEQKINKVIRSINDVGARLGAIVGIMSTRDDRKEYDDLLSDLGFN